jgi:hypothetical protein
MAGLAVRIPIPAVIMACLLGGCASSPRTAPGGWFIESWDNSVLTVRHNGYTYKARCDTSESFNNAGSITDEKNVVTFSTCDLAIGLVGHSVQPLDGKQRDLDGQIVVMWSVGHTLALRSWKDEHTPWRHENFIITSVTKTGH